MTPLQIAGLLIGVLLFLGLMVWLVIDDDNARRKQQTRDLTIGRDQHRAEQLAKLADWQRPAAKGFVAQRKINGGDGHGKAS